MLAHKRVKYDIEITFQLVVNIFNKALSMGPKRRVNLIYDIRSEFYEEVKNLLRRHDLLAEHQLSLNYVNLKNCKVIALDPIIRKYNEPLGINFCAKYSYDNRCIYAINYIDEGYCYLPSLLPFTKVNDFSIGNFAIPLKPGDYDVELKFSNGAKSVGYAYHVTPRKLKPALYIFGVTFPEQVISEVAGYYTGNRCKCNEYDLDEIQIGNIPYPIIFICRKCGQLFTCECFENYVNIQDDIIRILPHGGRDDYLKSQVKQIKTKENICHMCKGGIPKIQYGSSMYYSSFMQRYLPYHILQSRKSYGTTVYAGEAYKTVENEIRQRFGYPKIGERWLSETLLYKTVKMLFFPRDTVFHYRGKELDGLEIDIWIPELNIAIEYQGEQHYGEVKHWGGKQGLQERKKRDRRKKALCKELNYEFIEFKHNESLTVEHIERRLKRFLKK